MSSITADQRLALIRVKVERAKKHIHDLTLAVRAFLDTSPYEVGTRTDPQVPDSLTYYVVSIRETPHTISAVIGEILFNLRSALDNLAYQLAIVNGTTDEPTLRATYFPISEDAAKYKTDSPRKVKGMSQAAIQAIDTCRPYKGGNDALWRLHILNNIDKHRVLVTVGISLHAISANTIFPRGVIHLFPSASGIQSRHSAPDKLLLFPENPKLLSKGDILFIDPSGAKTDQRVAFRFDIAFNEPGIVDGEPLLPTLLQLVELVDNTILTFKPLLT
jgi:hypothetical protein